MKSGQTPPYLERMACIFLCDAFGPTKPPPATENYRELQHVTESYSKVTGNQLRVTANRLREVTADVTRAYGSTIVWDLRQPEPPKNYSRLRSLRSPVNHTTGYVWGTL